MRIYGQVPDTGINVHLLKLPKNIDTSTFLMYWVLLLILYLPSLSRVIFFEIYQIVDVKHFEGVMTKHVYFFRDIMPLCVNSMNCVLDAWTVTHVYTLHFLTLHSIYTCFYVCATIVDPDQMEHLCPMIWSHLHWFKKRIVLIVIRQHRCAALSESTLFAHAIKA
jgi:hypothetical protein